MDLTLFQAVSIFVCAVYKVLFYVWSYNVLDIKLQLYISIFRIYNWKQTHDQNDIYERVGEIRIMRNEESGASIICTTTK